MQRTEKRKGKNQLLATELMKKTTAAKQPVQSTESKEQSQSIEH